MPPGKVDELAFLWFGLPGPLLIVVGFGGIPAIHTEFPYRVPIVDGGTIAAPLFAAPVSDS